MSTCMDTLLADQRKLEAKRETSCSQCGNATGPGKTGYSHCADHRRAAALDRVFLQITRQAQTFAARMSRGPAATFAEQHLMALNSEIGALRSKVAELSADLEQFERVTEDKNLEYVALCDEDLGDVTVGIEYQPEIAPSPTSAFAFARTGDPGDPGEAEVCEITECWFRGVEIAAALSQSTVDRLAVMASAAMRKRGADAAEDHALARAGL